MIITFCGHSQFSQTEKIRQEIMNILEERVNGQCIDMYLGGYGEFDIFAYECCKQYKEAHLGASLILITPYITLQYQRSHLDSQKHLYDGIIYPDIEDKPLGFAISYRNKYMVDKSDLIIAYVSHKWGGAYKMYEYAKKEGKEIINLAEVND